MLITLQNGTETTLFILVLVIVGLFFVLAAALMSVAKIPYIMNFGEKVKPSYKNLVLGLPILMVLLWYFAQMSNIPMMDKYVLSIWPVLVALLILILANYIDHKKEKMEIEEFNNILIDDMQKQIDDLEVKLEKEKAKNKKPAAKKTKAS